MPPLGETTDELRIVEWLKAAGDRVEVGEPLLAVETDKAELEVEAAAAGTLLKIVCAAGETVRTGTIVCYVGLPGEEIVGEPAPKVQAAPAVRRLAGEHGVDLGAVRGSGPGGRVEKEDVLAFVDTAGGRDLTVSRHRRAIAERLTRSVQTIPQFTVGVSVDLTKAAELPVTPLLLQAMAGALRAHPAVNRLWLADGPRLRQLERADVGLAVAGEETLLVVAIPEPDRLSLDELAGEVERAAGEAREGRVSEGYRRRVAVTLSNLGPTGVDWFAAIVDPDQTAVLAAGRVQPDGRLELTLTVDHRVLDGFAAARFLQDVRERLESSTT